MTVTVPFALAVMGAFAKDAKLIVGCKAGGRSARAASMLDSAGYTSVVDQRAHAFRTIRFRLTFCLTRRSMAREKRAKVASVLLHVL